MILNLSTAIFYIENVVFLFLYNFFLLRYRGLKIFTYEKPRACYKITIGIKIF